jgi:polyisoprenoid-binding protein YceI
MATTDASTTTTAVPTGTWVVDPAHTSVGFSVKHMGISTVRGTFGEFEGRLEIGADLASAKAYGTVKAAAVDTGQDQRDEHLRSPDFFDAAQYADITFESTKIESVDTESLRITGNLTMHGVTKEITLDAVVDGTETDPMGNERVGLEVAGQISRGEFGMKFNQALGSGNVAVSDKVKIALDISAIKQS